VALPEGWESWTLERLYEALPNGECDGCDGCGSKCAGQIKMARWEFERMHACWPVGFVPARREQTGPFAAPCVFRDEERGRCAVYEARPLICRLFGLVEWLPCPLGRWPARLPQGLEIVKWYARQELHTYAEWAALVPDGSNAP